MLHHPDDEAADDVDKEDHDARNGIPFDKLGGTIHGAVEVSFLGYILTTLLRLFLIDKAGVQIGIDGHLFARHRIKGKTGTHFRDPPGTLGNDHKVDDHQDGENDDADRIVAADHHVTERLDHMAGRRTAIVTFQ